MTILKPLFTKLFKWFLILCLTIISIRLILEVPAIPFTLNTEATLDDVKVLIFKDYKDSDATGFDKDAVYLRTYTNNESKTELLYEIPKIRHRDSIIEAGIIINGTPILILEEPNQDIDRGIYIYKNGQLVELYRIKHLSEKLIKIDNNTLGVVYDTEVKTFDLNGDSEKNQTYTFAKEEYNDLLADLGYVEPKEEFKINFEENKVIYNSGGYYGILRFWYVIRSIARKDSDGNKATIDKIVDLNIFDLWGNGKSYWRTQMSADNKYLMYDNDYDMYVLDIATGRKKLVEEDAWPIYME